MTPGYNKTVGKNLPVLGQVLLCIISLQPRQVPEVQCDVRTHRPPLQLEFPDQSHFHPLVTV